MVNWIGKVIEENIESVDTVLDLGCGIMQATDDLRCKSILGCDIWPVYLDKIKYLHPTITLRMDELDRFRDNSYDVVIALDIVEHLEKDLALKSIKEMQRIARKMVFVYTPARFKTNEENTVNVWELGACDYQKHLCLVTKQELEGMGFSVTTNPENLGIWKKSA